MKNSFVVWANLIIGLIVVLAGLRVYLDYRETMDGAFEHLENLARIGDEQVSGSLKAIDILVQDVAQASRSVSSESEEATLLLYMKTRIAGLEELRTLYLTDGRGKVTTTTMEQLKDFDASQRSYYTGPQNAADRDHLFVSGPLRASVSGEWVLFLSRSRPTAGRAWGGIAVASLTPAYFTHVLDSVVPQAAGLAEIVTRAGDIVARSPSQDHMFGQNISNPSFAAFLASGVRSDHLVKTTVSEGIRRLMVYRVTNYPGLVVIVGQTEASVLAVWYRNTLITSLALALLLAMAVFTMRRFAAHERGLRESQERLRLLFETNSDAIFVSGIDERGAPGHFEDVNTAACRYLGYSREALLRLTPVDIDPDIDRDLPELLAHLQSGGSSLVERTHVARDGRRIPVELHAQALEMVGRPMVLAVVRDITERRQAEQRLREAEAKNRELSDLNQKIITESPFGVQVYDETGQCIMVNQASACAVGTTRERMLAQNYHHIQSWKTYGLYEAAVAALAKGRCEHHTTHFISTFGRESWLDYYIIPVIIGGRPHLLLLLDDITARQQAEAALREAVREAEAANRAKSAFLAMMSHELRTPMTGVIGMADFLSETQLNEDQRLYIDTMRSSAKTLLTVLNDILDYSKIDADRLTLDSVSFDAVALTAETVRLFWPKAEENATSLTLDMDGADRLVVKGDPTRFKQVLGNLVSNAVKFTKQGKVTIHFRHHLTEEGLRLRFEVEDTGIGISEADLGRLFIPFSQADAGTTRKFGGTGLGLAISKRLVVLMGGEIGATSRLGRGTTFWFTCHVEPGVADEIASGQQQPVQAVSPMTILLAEDNPINRMIVKVGLEQRHHHVTVVENGVQAYEAAAAKRYDLILMDMQMPLMDGTEATRRIRTLAPPFSDVPIVALTADALTEHRAAYMQAGLTDFLTKPIEWTEVDGILSRHYPELKREHVTPITVFDIDAHHNEAVIPVLDRKRFLDIRTMMVESDFIDLISEFGPCSKSEMSRLHNAIAQDDIRAIRRISHDIKGMFSNIGALRVVVIAKRLQGAKDIHAAAEVAQTFEKAVAEAVEELERERGD